MQTLGKTPMDFFVDKWTIQGRAARCKPVTESDTMSKTEKFCVFLLSTAAFCVVSFIYWALLNSMK
jgi:hypothetical protein